MRSKNIYAEIPKERALQEFENTCNQVGAIGLLDVKQDSLLVRAVDRVLQHGLRDPVRGYWSLVRSLTHSTTLKSLEAFVKYISSSQQKGLAWTFYTLDEGSLEYYLSSLMQDSRTVNQHYLESSLLRDPSLAQRVVTTISNLRAEAAAIQASMESSMASECTASLASPVDSGVAFMDNDATSDTDKNDEYSRAQEETWKPIFSSSVATETSTSSDNTIADENSNPEQTEPAIDNQTKPIISQNKYDGVCRRRKKKKSEPGKRVSFHQDSHDDSDTPVLKHDSNLNRFYVEGRYSWAGEGDSYFFKENENFRQIKSEVLECKGLSSNISIFDSEMGIEADCGSSTTTLDDAKHNIEIVCEKLTNVVKQSLGLKTKEDVFSHKSPSAFEREAPEGQEDPEISLEFEKLSAATQRSQSVVRSSVDLTSDSEWSLDTPDRLTKRLPFFKHPGFQRTTSTPGQPNWPARILYETPSKTSLVKRFLRSIPTRKLNYKVKTQIRKPDLYIKGVKPDLDLVQSLLHDLEKEMKENTNPKIKSNEKREDEEVTEVMRIAFKEAVFLNKTEKIYKVYKVASTEGEPLLAVLSDTMLYMVGLTSDNKYCRRHHICYLTLDTLVIGPEHQTLMLVTSGNVVSVTVICALGHTLVTQLVTWLAHAVLRAANTHLSVFTLHLTSMQALFKALTEQTPVAKDERLLYLRYIRVEDTHLPGACNPLGPTKCGHLMYRSHSHSSWLPGYILLKAGVLYVFSDLSQKTPKHILSLHHGYFGGCRRVSKSNRPHTFEILPVCTNGLTGTFQFAAADDYESSDWLQAFIQTSSLMNQNAGVSEEPLTGCALLLTSRHLLTLNFPDKVLSCARLQDITTIRTTTTCCILETSCREVQGSGGDWILYFLTEQAISEFLDILYQIRPELKQMAMDVWECRALKAHCLKTSHLVRTAWDPLLNPLNHL